MTKIASVAISPEFDLPDVAARAGQTDMEKFWYQGGRFYVEGITQKRLTEAAKLAVVSVRLVRYSTREFFERFTKEERLMLRALARDDDDIDDLLELIRATPIVDAKDSAVQGLLGRLVEVGAITQERKAEILGESS